MIDWTNSMNMISQYFSVREALWLPQWGRLATEADGLTDEIKNALIDLSSKMDQIRDLLGYPMHVTSCYRPPSYSVLVGGSATDPHTKGMAMDFTPEPFASCDHVKAILEPQLEKYSLRMERGTINWVHLDMMPVGHARYFNP